MKRKKFSGGLVVIALLISTMISCSKDTEYNEDISESVNTNLKATVELANYYVAVNGNDGNTGTIDKPFATWQKAWTMVQPGQLVYIRGGVYRFKGTIGDYACAFKNKTGTADKPIRIWAYPGENPVFNLDDKNPINSGYHSIISQENTTFCHFKGLRVTGLSQPTTGQAGYGWVVTNSSNNKWENCEFDHIGGYPFFITGKSANNLVLNCDAHHSADPYSAIPYGGSNGFNAIQIPTGYDNNTFRGCRSWMNSDDGFDTYSSNGSINFENCWAFWNGFQLEEQVPVKFIKTGDGDGFKLGNSTMAYDGKFRRTATNCLSVHNNLMGFDQNSLSSAFKIVNCTSYKNSKGGFHTQADGHANYFRNNIDYANLGSSNFNSYAVNDHNSWNLKLNITNSDFKSVNESLLLTPRKADGSLPDIDFLKPTATSCVVGKGTTSVDLTFSSTSVDLGAIQSSLTTVTPITPVTATANYYVATNGNDANAGTIDKPFKTWTKAWSVVQPGQLIYVRGGTYRITGNLGDNGISLTGKNGTSGKLIKFWAYPGETPILDLGDKIGTGYHTGLNFSGNYCHIKGIEVRNTPMSQGRSSYGFVARDGSNNIFENFNTHHNQGRGFLIMGKSSNNLVLNSDSHNNSDPLSTEVYGNADGFAAGLIPSAYGNNTFRGCRAWANTDDGYDLWDNEGSVKFENCWAFGNGYIPGTSTKAGDGTGFKLGRAFGPYDGTFKRVLQNCLASGNRQNGFSQNGANLAVKIINCTSFANGLNSFVTKNDGNPHYLRNNIQYKNGGVLSITATVNDHNSWNLGITITDNDFISTDPKALTNTRKGDGSLPDLGFMKPKTTSLLAGKGINVGLTYLGTAPDLGAFSCN